MTPTTTGEPAVRRGSSFLDGVQREMAMVEDHLRSAVASDVGVMYDLSSHVLSAGGKRLRPALTVLAALAVDGRIDARRITGVAAGIELIHMATLIHDDVVDHTRMRRGRPTANAIHGNGIAVVTGDFLLARAMRLFASDGDMQVIRLLSDVTVEMSEGEVMEALATGNAELSEASYREILRRKTAVFIAGCCRCGVVLADGNERQDAAMAHYGLHLGMAFQIIDDLLDYTGNPALTGKPVASDLREGRATLPFLRALDRVDDVDRRRLLAAFGDPDMDAGTIAAVLDAIERTGAYAATRAAARAEAGCAVEHLTELPSSPARDGLCALADHVVERDR